MKIDEITLITNFIPNQRSIICSILAAESIDDRKRTIILRIFKNCDGIILTLAKLIFPSRLAFREQEEIYDIKIQSRNLMLEKPNRNFSTFLMYPYLIVRRLYE